MGEREEGASGSRDADVIRLSPDPRVRNDHPSAIVGRVNILTGGLSHSSSCARRAKHKQPTAAMAIHYTIWVPAVVLAHAVGVGLLLYSVEKVTGVLSQTLRRFARGKHALDVTVTPSSNTFSSNAQAADEGAERRREDDGEDKGDFTRPASHWARGCACSVGFDLNDASASEHCSSPCLGPSFGLHAPLSLSTSSAALCPE